MSTKYLYGASVHGIQDFIFETNKLTDIVGASEFVEKVCTSLFEEATGIVLKNNPSLIQSAAGNIRFLFDKKEDCEKAVRFFPFKIESKAPGMQLSQAVVEIEGNLTTTHISELILKLDQQRNKLKPSFFKAQMIARRSRQTGQAAISSDSEHLSVHQILKQKYNESNSLKKKIGAEEHKWKSGDLEDLVKNKKGRDEWLAIIHADGNNLGKLIIKINSQLNETGQDVQAFYRQFSYNLDKATITATRLAYQTVFANEISANELVPFRPVLLGGDDLTVILKARFALEFTKLFLHHFEAETSKLIWPLLSSHKELIPFMEGLTTCAGIAFIKPNYPFHYGVKLADGLCKQAKRHSKNLNSLRSPSSLMFHQVHSSFVGEWEDIAKRELELKENQGSFEYGPYFLTENRGYSTIEQLQKWKSIIQEADAPKSQLRALITAYIDNPAGAMQYERRMHVIDAQKEKAYLKKLGISPTIFFERKGKNVSPIWDIIKISTIENKKS